MCTCPIASKPARSRIGPRHRPALRDQRGRAERHGVVPAGAQRAPGRRRGRARPARSPRRRAAVPSDIGFAEPAHTISPSIHTACISRRLRPRSRGAARAPRRGRRPSPRTPRTAPRCAATYSSKVSTRRATASCRARPRLAAQHERHRVGVAIRGRRRARAGARPGSRAARRCRSPTASTCAARSRSSACTSARTSSTSSAPKRWRWTVFQIDPRPMHSVKRLVSIRSPPADDGAERVRVFGDLAQHRPTVAAGVPAVTHAVHPPMQTPRGCGHSLQP